MQTSAGCDIGIHELANLEARCDRVARAVGQISIRLCVVPLVRSARGARHMVHLMQMSNFWRNLNEDTRSGRHYVPREMEGARIADVDPGAATVHWALGRARLPAIARVRQQFAQPWKIVGRFPGRGRSPRRKTGAVADGVVPRRSSTKLDDLRCQHA